MDEQQYKTLLELISKEVQRSKQKPLWRILWEREQKYLSANVTLSVQCPLNPVKDETIPQR